MSIPPPDDVQYLGLAESALHAPAAKVAGGEVAPAEVEDWIRRQLD